MEPKKLLVLFMGPSRELVVTNSERCVLGVDPEVLFFIFKVQTLSEVKFFNCTKVKAIVGNMVKEFLVHLVVVGIFITIEEAQE